MASSSAKAGQRAQPLGVGQLGPGRGELRRGFLAAVAGLQQLAAGLHQGAHRASHVVAGQQIGGLEGSHP
jgi:hypothetical protein